MSKSRHCTGFSTTASSEVISGLFSRRILFRHASGFDSLLSVALCFDRRDVDDDSVFDSAGCSGDNIALTVNDGEEGCCSESLLPLVIVDKLWAWGRIVALPSFCCSATIFSKYLACSSMRNWRALCTWAISMQTADQILKPMWKNTVDQKQWSFLTLELWHRRWSIHLFYSSNTKQNREQSRATHNEWRNKKKITE